MAKAKPVVIPVVRPSLDDLFQRIDMIVEEHRADRDGSAAALGFNPDGSRKL